MSTGDQIAAVALVVAVLSCLVTWYYSYKAKILAEQVNEAQGIFKSPSLRIRLFGEDQVEEWILAVPLAKERYVEVPLGLDIGNAGEKSALEVEILVRLAKDLCYGGQFPLVISSPMGKITGRQFSDTETLITYIISAQSLNPKESLSLPLKLSLSHDTFLQSSVSAPLRDGNTVSIPYSIDYAYRIDLIITQRDQQPTLRGYDIHVMNTSAKPMQDLLTEYNERIASGLSPLSWREKFTEAIGLRRTPATDVCVAEFGSHNIIPDQRVPINRFTENGSVSLHKGKRLRAGFVFPSLQVMPSPSEPKKP